MNPLLKEAADQVPLGWLLGVMTVVFLSTFLFWTWWAYRAGNRERWEEASRMPLNDGGES